MRLFTKTYCFRVRVSSFFQGHDIGFGFSTRDLGLISLSTPRSCSWLDLVLGWISAIGGLGLFITILTN